MKKTWKLEYFDTFCLGMVIKSAWIYDQAPDFEKMKSSLKELLSHYPQLTGYYDESCKSIVWDDTLSPEPVFETIDLRSVSKSELTANPKKTWSQIREYDVKGFKAGKVQPFSAVLAYLKDGAALYVRCAHATMDGHSFYGLAGQWAALYRGEQIQPMVGDQSLLPSSEAMPKAEALEAVKKDGWICITAGKMVKMLWRLFRSQFIKDVYVEEVTQEEIASLRENSGAGTNAVLCAVAASRLFSKLPERSEYKILEVADLRGHFPGIDEAFFGNFSQPFTVDAFKRTESVAEVAGKVDAGVKSYLSSDKPERIVRLSFMATHYGFPYFFFDASDINSPDPMALYCNNQLKFKACELDWGHGLPLYAFPNELSDMVKFWQPVAGGPVQLIYAGFASRIMKR